MPTHKEEKETKRQTRAAEKRRAVEAEITEARRQVELFDKAVKDIVSTHQVAHTNIDWASARFSLRPHSPIKVAWACVREIADTHMSSIFPSGKIVNSKGAEEEDSRENVRREGQHAGLVENWKTLMEVGTRLGKGEPGALIEAWSEVSKRGIVSGVGEKISVTEDGEDQVYAEIMVEGKGIVPAENKTLTSAKRLSIKPMPKGRTQEIYEDYVCSRCIVAAGAVFATLPVREVIVNAVVVGEERGRGVPVVSVHFTRESFGVLKMDELDPSDALQSFQHIGNVRGSKKGAGFVEIRPLTFPSRDLPEGSKRGTEGLVRVLKRGRELLEKLSKRVQVGEREYHSAL